MIQYLPVLPMTFIFAAIVNDFVEMKIRNVITYPLVALGFLLQLYQHGIKTALGSFVIAFIIVIVISSIRFLRLGGGDVKLCAGLSFFIPTDSIIVFIIALFAFMTLYNMFLLVKRCGISELGSVLFAEIFTRGIIKHQAERIIGAPIIALSFLVTILFF